MKNYKKIIILMVLFVGIAGFCLAPASAAKTYTSVTKLSEWEGYSTIKQTKNHVINSWDYGYLGAKKYKINKIYVKIHDDQKGNVYVYSPKLKKTQKGGKLKVVSETYKITVRKADSYKFVKNYTKTVKPGKKLYLKLPKNSWISDIKVTSKYKY